MGNEEKMNIGIVILEENNNIEDKSREEIKNSICRYLKYAVFKNGNKVECEQKLWYEFWDKWDKKDENKFKDKKDENKFEDKWDNINAILFLSFEKMPFGDEPEALWSKTRPVRLFVENTMCAISADWRNVLVKLKELLLKWF